MVDSTLISSVKKRDNKAFKVLYNSCIAYVFSIVRRYVSNEKDHQDVIQEIFARIFLSIKTFDESKGEFKFWLRRLTINQCMQNYRKKSPPGLFVSLDAIHEVETSMGEKLTELTKEEIETLLSQMPEGYRQVFMLVIIDEYSHKEVADLLKISSETSRSQLSRAKKWLRNNMLNTQKILISGI